MKKHLALALWAAVALVTTAPITVHASGGPRDGQTPAVERVCDDAGLHGAAYGLCVAFCEAQDCDLQPNTRSCRELRRNYLRATRTDVFPCELPVDNGGDDNGGGFDWTCFGESVSKPDYCYGL